MVGSLLFLYGMQQLQTCFYQMLFLEQFPEETFLLLWLLL